MNVINVVTENDEGIDIRNLTIAELVNEIDGCAFSNDSLYQDALEAELDRRKLTYAQAAQIAEED